LQGIDQRNFRKIYRGKSQVKISSLKIIFDLFLNRANDEENIFAALLVIRMLAEKSSYSIVGRKICENFIRSTWKPFLVDSEANFNSLKILPRSPYPNTPTSLFVWVF
jgi:hypothetical protein